MGVGVIAFGLLPQICLMDDLELVEAVAREFVAREGEASLTYLRERAEVAQALGDELSARAWLDIASVAERIAACPGVPKAQLGPRRA